MLFLREFFHPTYPVKYGLLAVLAVRFRYKVLDLKEKKKKKEEQRKKIIQNGKKSF